MTLQPAQTGNGGSRPLQGKVPDRCVPLQPLARHTTMYHRNRLPSPAPTTVAQPSTHSRTYAQGLAQALAQLAGLQPFKLSRRLLSGVALPAALCPLHG